MRLERYVVRRIRVLVAATVLLWSSPMYAQIATWADAWFPAGLSHNACVQRGEAAFGRAGAQNVRTAVNFPGMAWISGSIGEYSITVACVTAKDVIMFYGAGPQDPNNKSIDYLKGIRKDMGG
jgi:hypothetical protein